MMQKNLTLHLPQYSVICATGEDAARFLHGQLSHDFLLLEPQQARLAAYCNPKGRMLASLIARHIDAASPESGFYLILATDLLEPILKRLRMFVLRAKVKLEDMRGQCYVQGYISDSLAPQIADWSVQDERIKLPKALGAERWLSVLQGASPGAPSPDLLAHWNWLEVHSGVAMVQAATSELFVPQMLNYESVGGINFKKGCYPGQEVVARSQFRGQIKRRGVILCTEPSPVDSTPSDTTATTSNLAGLELSVSPTSEESCGTVAQSAHYQGRTALIASLQTKALMGNTHFYCQGRSYTLQDLPYPILEDI